MSLFLDSKYSSLVPYVPGEQPQNTIRIKLNTNECPYPPSERVVQAAARAAARLNLYPDPTAGTLLDRLAATLGVGREQVFVGNGSDEILAFCFQAFCQRGAAFADITYGFYKVYAQLYGVDAKIIPLREDFSLAPEDYHHLRRTIFIANPNAPTGLALSRAQMKQILAANPDSLVVVDEAYVDFGAETAVPLLEEHENLLVVGTFSKSRAMAGARLGYAVGSPALVADLNLMKFSFNPYNLNSMTMAAGMAVLEDEAYFRQCVDKIMATRAGATSAMRDMGFICTNSLANFIFATHLKLPAQTLQKQLREKGILVRWFNAPKISSHLRITVGSNEEMALLCDALQTILAKA